MALSETLTDDLIQQAADGDRQAQAEIYHALGERLHLLVRRIVGPEDSEDVSQDVFVQLFRKLHTFQFQSSFVTWAYRLAVNHALQHLRSRRRHKTVELDDANVAGKTDGASLETRELLERGLQMLDPELRVILQLKEIDQLPYEEIAKVIGIPAGTVGSRLNRARRELRERLLRLGWEG